MRPAPLKGLLASCACVASLLMASVSHATDPIAAGRVSLLTHRNGYVMFKVVSDSGVNGCAPCPGDPAAYAAGGNCWIADTETARLAIVYMARAQGEQILGRVADLATNCSMYQLTLTDG